MVVARDPAVERRRLRVELRRLRQEAHLTQRDVAQVMEWSTSKLIRIENGDVGISANDLKALLAYYGVADNKERVEELLESARAARKESWSEFKDVHSAPFLTYLGFESSAQIVREFEPLLIPGLLQTEEYCLAQQAGVSGHSRERAERRWVARERRQEMHERDQPPEMHFILDEAVIRRAVGGPGVMRRQLQRLKELIGAKHVTIQIVPFRAGAHPGMKGPFILLAFAAANEDDMLYLEHSGGEVTTRDDVEATSAYTDRFFELLDKSLNQRESAQLIDSVIEEFEKAEVASGHTVTADAQGKRPRRSGGPADTVS